MMPGGGGGGPGKMPPGQGGGFGGNFLAQKDAERLLNEAAAIEQNLDLMQSPQEVRANLKKGNKATLGFNAETLQAVANAEAGEG